MTFWDSSALAALLLAEETSSLREEQYRSDPAVLIWFATPAEIESALTRRRRDGSLAREEENHARRRLFHLSESWMEVEPRRQVRDRAIRLLRVHPLRAADALQLAAALVCSRERPETMAFLTGDQRLRSAAEAEGFTTS
jgi:uncharacterized protein